jgi:phospholipid-binding lipoprotein MlaA
VGKEFPFRTAMKESEHHLSYLLFFVLLLLVFSSMGCAHRGVTNPVSGSPEAVVSPGACRSDVGQTWKACQSRSTNSASAFDPVLSKKGTVKGESSTSDLGVFLDEGPEQEVVRVADPLQSWNRAMFHFNDKLYFWLLKPAAKGYRAVFPRPVRSGVRNFFHNITAPIRIVSALLQGKGRSASAELTSFLINSTVGILGFGDPAGRWPELDSSEEDFGQTLATYGIGNGWYIVWPILGPSTLRDSVGMVGDWLLDPTKYVDPVEASVGLWVVDNVNETSFHIGDYESLKEAAIDPYISLRNAYIQNRKKKVEE